MKKFTASVSVQVTEKDTAEWPAWIAGKLDLKLVEIELGNMLFEIIEDMVLDRQQFNFNFRVEEEKEVK